MLSRITSVERYYIFGGSIRKRRYRFGVVANASGDIYTYGYGDAIISARLIDDTIEKYKKMLDDNGNPVYSSYREAHLAALDSLKESWGIWYEAW